MPEPVGYGLPWWLDTSRYLTAQETKDIGPALWATVDGKCPVCLKRIATDKAHIVRKGMGGAKQPGPMVGLCRECHTGPGGLDRCETWAIAMTRGRHPAPALVTENGTHRPLSVLRVQ